MATGYHARFRRFDDPSDPEEDAMAAEPLLEYQEVFTELLGFVAAFCAAGSIGCRYAVLRRLPKPGTPDTEESLVLAGIARRSAWLGFGGLFGAALLLALRLPAFAARRHTTIGALIGSEPQLMLQVGALALGLLGFLLAANRRGYGWPLAALAVLALPLRGLVTGQLLRLVNPVHMLAGGLWIGTLAQLVVLGIAGVRGSRLPAGRKGALVAEMVRGFSPLALGAFGLLAVLGVVTAWRHLKHLEALWTTPYGYALLAKLAVVACVIGLGAYNWKRLTPALGTDAASAALVRSARRELILAGVVLVLTAVLVSLPSPK